MKQKNQHKKFLFLLYSIKRSGKSTIFDDKKINKNAFNKNKELIQIDNVHGNKILVSKMEPYGKKGSSKYIIGYNDNCDIRPLYIKLHEMIG